MNFLLLVLVACFFFAAVSPACKNARRIIDASDSRFD